MPARRIASSRASESFLSIPSAIASLLIKGGLPDALPADPMPTLKSWHDEGMAKKLVPNPNAMAVSTVSVDGRPSVRYVLCRSVETGGGVGGRGAVVFYTNYLSRKGREIESTGRVSAAMHWDHAERQARVEGVAVRMSEAESDEYFRSRELLKRLAAWASEQSAPITTRSEMIDKMLVVMKRFGVTIPEALRGESSAVVPRPPHWGGYRIVPGVVELWAGGQGRMHDRAAWTWTNAGWTATRLQP